MTRVLVRHQHRVLTCLDEAGVDYVVLRGSLGGGDLDLLVRSVQVRLLTATVARLGIIPAPSEHHWPHRLLVGYLPTTQPADAEAGGVHVVVDVLDRLVVRGLVLGGPALTAAIVAARVFEDGVARPAAADAAWIEALSALLGPSNSPVADTARTLDPASPVAQAVDDRHGPGTAVRLASWLAENRVEAARGLLRRVRARREPAGDRLARSATRWAGRLRRQHVGRSSTGVRVVLLGPDGAGKSTLSQGLVDALPLPVHEIYMGVFRLNRWHRISRYLPGTGLTTRVIGLTWRSAKAQWYARRGHVVVFDRYTYDAGLRPGARGFRSRVSYFMIERSVRAPDVVIVLDAPGEVMFERKREHDISTLEQRRGWYLDIASTLPNAVVVDATQPPAVVLQQAVNAVWRTIHGA